MDCMSLLHLVHNYALKVKVSIMSVSITTGLCVPSRRLFFKTVLYGNDRDTLSQLVTVLLERVLLLYKMESFQTETRDVISDQLLEILKLHSHFVIDFQREILEFLSNLRTLNSGGEYFYMHLVCLSSTKSMYCPL